MGDTPDTKEDAFEFNYNRFKDREVPLAQSEAEKSDRIITQYLQEKFNENSGILLDRKTFSGGVPKFTDVEKEMREAAQANWNPDHSHGLVSDAVGYVTSFISDPDAEKTPEQLASDANARALIARERDQTDVLNDLIKHTPSLKGFTLDDAVSIAKSDANGEIGTTIPDKFPEADANTAKALAYTMLHAHRTEIDEPTLKGTDFAEIARGYMHYSTPQSDAYNAWSAERTAQAVKELRSNPEFLAAVSQIKCPDNISTAEDVRDQAVLREQIADIITDSFAASYGVADILDKDDTTVVYKSAKQIDEDGGTMGYMTFKEAGILNDEVIALRYSPNYHLMDRNTYKAETDSEEAHFFIRAATEEVYHGIHQIQADKLVIGSLKEDDPIHHNATMGALNWIAYAGGTRSSFEEYSKQYIESEAKAVASTTADQIITLGAIVPDQSAPTADSLPTAGTTRP